MQARQHYSAVFFVPTSVANLDRERSCGGGDRAGRVDGRHGGKSYCGGGCNNKIFSFNMLRVPYTQYRFLSRVACFWSCSCLQKTMKFLTKGGIDCTSRSLLGTFILCAGTHWSNCRSMMTVLLISSYIVCIHTCTAAFVVHSVYR